MKKKLEIGITSDVKNILEMKGIVQLQKKIIEEQKEIIDAQKESIEYENKITAFSEKEISQKDKIIKILENTVSLLKDMNNDKEKNNLKNKATIERYDKQLCKLFDELQEEKRLNNKYPNKKYGNDDFDFVINLKWKENIPFNKGVIKLMEKKPELKINFDSFLRRLSKYHSSKTRKEQI